MLTSPWDESNVVQMSQASTASSQPARRAVAEKIAKRLKRSTSVRLKASEMKAFRAHGSHQRNPMRENFVKRVERHLQARVECIVWEYNLYSGELINAEVRRLP